MKRLILVLLVWGLMTPALAQNVMTSGRQKTQIVDGAGNVIAATSNNLNVQCANCSGSGVSTADQASFTAGSSLFAGVGGFFQTTPTSNPLTTGQQGLFQVTSTRALFTNLRNAAGTEVGTSTTPLSVTVANTGANAAAMLVTGAGGTFPVTGTITANAGTGTFTVTGAGGTFPVTGTITANAGTGTFTVAGTVTANAGTGNFTVVQGTASSLLAQVSNNGTFAVQGTIASGGVASGAFAAGSIASGAAVSGSFVAGAIADLAHGQATMAGSVPVAIASNQGNLPVSQATAASLNATVVGTGTFAVQASVPTWGGGTLGAMANYGVSPGAVLVPGVNAFITNVPTVAQATAANLNATVVGTGTFAVQAATTLPVNVTLTDCSGTVTTGGTAVNAFTAQTTLHGFTILNDDTSEVMWVSFTTTAAASTAGSYPLAPATATTFAGASSFTSPPGMGTNHALSVVAATTAHKFSCTWW